MIGPNIHPDVSVERGDPCVTYVKVFLNGEDVTSQCDVASESGGYVRMIDPNVYTDGHATIARYYLTGEVVIQCQRCHA